MANKNKKEIEKKLEEFEFNDVKATSFIKKFTIILVVIVVVGLSAFSGLYVYTLSPTEASNDTEVKFVVNQGESVNSVLERLEEEGFIRSAFFAKIYVKYNSTIDTFYAGTYTLKKSYTLEDTLATLAGVTNAKGETISVQFVEGKRLTYYADVIAKNFNYTSDEVMAKLNDEEFVQRCIDKYWFITDDVLDSRIYYPLEGYLFPDTYEFNENASLEDIIFTMLKKMDSVLSDYKDEINSSPYGVHGLLTMASMVELEAVSAEDRAEVAGVFYNRLAKGWSLGSDVTTYYGVKKDLTESLTYADLNDCSNGYNTRGACTSGLPVGPIACVSKSSIKGAIEPTETNNMYFVADINNKLYFAETESGHQANITYLKNNGLWPE